MEVRHKVSFSIGKEFEQHTAEFVISSDDIKNNVFHDLNLLEKMFLLHSLVLIEGILFQLAEGYITDEEKKARILRVKSMLSDKVKTVLYSILGGKNGDE